MAPARSLRGLARALTCALIAVLLTAASAGAGAEKQVERRLAAVASPVRLVPLGREPLTVGALHSYFGALDLRSFSDGIAVVNRLDLERYLLGLNEVPTIWPEQALRAQAIAARTYALWTLRQGRFGLSSIYGFDICATVACQVFAGADVVRTLTGFRWAKAVADTERQVIVYRGEPILARYHAISGGRTLDNPQAFPGERNYPYLRGVRSTTETAAPFYRWHVRFRVDRLERVLTAVGWWDETYGRLVEVRTVPSRARLHYPDVVYRGTRRTVRSTAAQLRDWVRDVAPRLFPKRYPSIAPATGRALPETFPSDRLTIETRGRRVLVVGRGWGHGVGMSQWGAYGMALQGARSHAILKHYYTGVDIVQLAGNRRIEVGVATALARVVVDGSFKVVDGQGRTLVPHALGRWTFRWRGPGVIAVDPPRGFGLPLRLSIVEAPAEVRPGQPSEVAVALSRPAEVATVVGGERGLPLLLDAGVHRVSWIAPTAAGEYPFQAVATSGRATSKSQTVQVAVTETVAPEDHARRDRGALVALLAVVALAVAAAAAKVVTARIRR